MLPSQLCTNGTCSKLAARAHTRFQVQCMSGSHSLQILRWGCDAGPMDGMCPPPAGQQFSHGRCWKGRPTKNMAVQAKPWPHSAMVQRTGIFTGSTETVFMTSAQNPKQVFLRSYIKKQLGGFWGFLWGFWEAPGTYQRPGGPRRLQTIKSICLSYLSTKMPRSYSNVDVT